MQKGVLFTATLLLSGCGTTYYNSNISDPAALERQRIIDKAYCTQAAAGSVPMPEVRYYQSGIQSYQINGNVRSYSSNGYSTNSSYNGVVTSYPNAGEAFSAGMANGMNMGAAIAAAQARKQVMQGCMYSLGWTTDKNAGASYLKPQLPAKTQGEAFFDMALAAAETGDPKMQTRVATAYLEGKDAPRDPEKAIYWLNKASEQGYSEASFQLSYIYFGSAYPQYKDQQMMLLYLQKAAEQGEGMAQSMIGAMYTNGTNGYPKDPKLAAKWFLKACENNDANGFFGMASLYALGEGVEKNPIKAYRLFVKAEELGNEMAAPYRSLLEQHMTRAQIQEAKGM